jgi:hypothetical protein
MTKFRINSSDMVKLRVFWVALGVMRHVEVMVSSYKTSEHKDWAGSVT